MGLFNLFKKPSVRIKLDGEFYITIHNRQEGEFYAAQMLKIVNDCANLINTTKNPKVFFERYDLLIEKLKQLSKLECLVHFRGNTPSKDLKQTLNKKAFTINDFIDRYYQDTIEKIKSLKTIQAKQKRIENFYQNLFYYNDCMLPVNIEKYTNLYKNKLLKEELAKYLNEVNYE